MEKHIKNGTELIQFFIQISKNKSRSFVLLNEGVFIDSQVRKEVLTGVDQGKISIDGVVERIEFKNLGDGVYRACIAVKKRQEQK